MILYGGAGVRGNNKIKMDFFLLHAVTGIHSLHSMLSDLTANEAAALLQAHFAITVFYYVTSGSPNLTDISKLLNYKSSKVAEWPQNPWTKIIDLALVSEMHLRSRSSVPLHSATSSTAQVRLWVQHGQTLLLQALTRKVTGTAAVQDSRKPGLSNQ